MMKYTLEQYESLYDTYVKNKSHRLGKRMFWYKYLGSFNPPSSMTCVESVCNCHWFQPEQHGEQLECYVYCCIKLDSFEQLKTVWDYSQQATIGRCSKIYWGNIGKHL
jgi:hypothetical protein